MLRIAFVCVALFVSEIAAAESRCAAVPLDEREYALHGVDYLMRTVADPCASGQPTEPRDSPTSLEQTASVRRLAVQRINAFMLSQLRDAIDAGDVATARKHHSDFESLLQTQDLAALGMTPLPPDLTDRLADITARAFWTHWSAGLIVNFKDEPSVESATVTSLTSGNIVRVERSDEIKVGFGIEAHKFVWGYEFGRLGKDFDSGIALGPYLSVMPGTTDIIDVLGAGIVLGIIGDSRYEKQGARVSMNVAGGWFFDFNSLHLEEGFVEGQPLPAGESEVRLREETDQGWQLVVSFTAIFH